MSILDTFIQHSFGNPGHSNQKRKSSEKYKLEIGIYPQISRYHTQKILKMLTKNFQSSLMNMVRLQDSKLIHRKLFHIYTLTTKHQKEIKETIPFTIISRRRKYLGINIPEGAKDLQSENYKTPMKIKEGKQNPMVLEGRINIVKMTTLPKTIYRLLLHLIRMQSLLNYNDIFHRTRIKKV